MPKFNLNKLRSAGLRYLVVDADGQAWAFEPPPVRQEGHWSLPAKFLPPDTMEDVNAYDAHWNKMLRWHLAGREITIPVSDVPIDLSWEDEPYDIVEHGLVLAEDFRAWPEF